MDNKRVNRRIKDLVWPLLRSNGFETFSQRTAWRHHSDRIDVLNFQSFSSYQTNVLECTTFSFAVNLGCFISTIPPHFEMSQRKHKNGLPIPHEYECHLRGRLWPTALQPSFRATDIWHLDETGENLEVSFEDVRLVIESDAIPWFQRFQSLTEVLRILCNEPEQVNHLWGFGANPSPIRHYFIGYVALSLNEHRCAIEHLEQALSSGCFSSVQSRLAEDVRRTAQQSPSASNSSP